MFSDGKKAREAHVKDALKDMIPEDPLSRVTKGEKDIEDLLDNAIKKVNKE